MEQRVRENEHFIAGGGRPFLAAIPAWRTVGFPAHATSAAPGGGIGMAAPAADGPVSPSAGEHGVITTPGWPRAGGFPSDPDRRAAPGVPRRGIPGIRTAPVRAAARGAMAGTR